MTVRGEEIQISWERGRGSLVWRPRRGSRKMLEANEDAAPEGAPGRTRIWNGCRPVKQDVNLFSDRGGGGGFVFDIVWYRREKEKMFQGLTYSRKAYDPSVEQISSGVVVE